MTDAPETGMTVQEIKSRNAWLADYLEGILQDGATEVKGLRRRLTISYWVVIVLSVVLFIIGVVLLSVPALAAFRGDVSELNAVIAGGFGLADLAALFLFRPIKQVRQIMGDLGQITVAVNAYQTQVALHLLAMDANDKPTIIKAAEFVNEAATSVIRLIQEYFEEDTLKEPQPAEEG